jgi:hypothetical protein
MHHVNLEEIVPRERAGSSTHARFGYQTEFIVYQCINMLADQEIIKVYCDFHSDCVVKDNKDFHVFYQVKGITTRLLSVSIFRKIALDDMFYNFSLADGNCRSILVTNAQVDSDLKRILEIKNHLHSNALTPGEKEELQAVKTTWRPKIDEKGLFDKFVEEFEVAENFPSFSETGLDSNPTLKSTNINWLKVVLDRTLTNNFSIEDSTHVHDMIYRFADEKSQLSTRYNRFITREELLDKIGVPSAFKVYFTHKFTDEEIESIKNQSILEEKLKNGKFSSYFIKNAKLVRYVTQYSREKLSQTRSIGNLIDEFEYKLTNICLEVFEEHVHNEVFNSLEMLNDLKAKLLLLAGEDAFKKLELGPDFVKGLIWEATSECNFRWDNNIE